jgi:lysozyme
MTPNKATVDLIRRFEGCELKAYRDSVGVWTIGYGHAATSGLEPIPHAGMTITKQKALSIFKRDLAVFSEKILPMFEVKPTPDQFGAMLSLAYNIGPEAFRRSTCLRRFNNGDVEGAAQALTWFNKAGGKKLRGLVRRRAAEHDLMLSDVIEDIPDSGFDEPKKPHQSTTNMAATAAGLSMVANSSADVRSVVENTGINPNLLFVGLGLLAVAWIFKERIKKMVEHGI